MALSSGTKLGPYEILSPLGAGGMGEVYLVRDTRLDRVVAIKVLPSTLAADPDRLQRFKHEARILSALNHPNLLAIYDVGSQDGIHYLVSEFLEDHTLRDLLQVNPLGVRRLIDFTLQAAIRLAAAHEKGIVHRDLKPENIFVTRDGGVKVLDFECGNLPHRRLGQFLVCESGLRSALLSVGRKGEHVGGQQSGKRSHRNGGRVPKSAAWPLDQPSLTDSDDETIMNMGHLGTLRGAIRGLPVLSLQF